MKENLEDDYHNVQTSSLSLWEGKEGTSLGKNSLGLPSIKYHDFIHPALSLNMICPCHRYHEVAHPALTFNYLTDGFICAYIITQSLCDIFPHKKEKKT